MNFYNLGMREALEKFAQGMGFNQHGIPRIAPMPTMRAPPARPAAAPTQAPAAGQPLAWKHETPTPVTASKPMPADQALMQQLGSSVAGGLSMPSKGRNVFASLRKHLL